MPTDIFGAYDTLIIDVQAVLYNRDEDRDRVIYGGCNLKSMMNTRAWYDYEAGNMSDAEVFASLALMFDVDEDDLEVMISEAIRQVKPRIDLFQSMRRLKAGRKIYAVANLSTSAWSMIKNQGAELWGVFDDVFISGETGTRLPEVSFFHHILSKTGARPENTIFVDDTRENLVTARSLGFQTVLYDTSNNVDRVLHNLCFDPVTRAHQFLTAHARRHFSFTLSTGEPIHENFCQILILEATGDASLVDFTTYKAEFNFFNDMPEFTTPHYPDDLDTTSVAWTVCPELADSATKRRVMDRMLTFCDGDGIPLVYFDVNRPRRDLVIAVNTVTLFFAEGRGLDLQDAANWIFSVLRTGAYRDGSRYYVGAEPFLYSMLRLLEKGPSISDDIRHTFKEQCQKRIGSPGDALALAMRIHCCNRAGIKNAVDLRRLLDLQQEDGGWEAGCFYRYGMTDRRVGNRGLTTAVAQRAIREYQLTCFIV